MRIIERNLDGSNGTRNVDTHIDVKSTQISQDFIVLHWPKVEKPTPKGLVSSKNLRKKIFFCSLYPKWQQAGKNQKPNRKARSGSIRKNNNLTIQIIDNHPGSHSVHHATVIAAQVKVDNWVQIKNKKPPNVS